MGEPILAVVSLDADERQQIERLQAVGYARAIANPQTAGHSRPSRSLIHRGAVQIRRLRAALDRARPPPAVCNLSCCTRHVCARARARTSRRLESLARSLARSPPPPSMSVVELRTRRRRLRARASGQRRRRSHAAARVLAFERARHAPPTSSPLPTIAHRAPNTRRRRRRQRVAFALLPSLPPPLPPSAAAAARALDRRSGALGRRPTNYESQVTERNACSRQDFDRNMCARARRSPSAAVARHATAICGGQKNIATRPAAIAEPQNDAPNHQELVIRARIMLFLFVAADVIRAQNSLRNSTSSGEL